MKSDLSASKRLVPFLSLLGLLLLLTVLTVVFSRQILSDAAASPRPSPGALAALVLGVPLVLLGAVAYQGWQLWRDHRARKPGTTLKARLSLFFLLTILLASLPQAALSLSFLDTVLKTWGSQRWGQALEGGLQTALDYHYERILTLRSTAESPRLAEAVQRTLDDPEAAPLGQSLAEENLRADAVEVYDPEGDILARAGRPEAFLTDAPDFPDEDGTLPQQTVDGATVLRQLRHLDLDEGPVRVVVATILPVGFEATSQRLTEALDDFNALQRATDAFRSLFFLFYVVLSLPILLIALLISFTQSDDLIQPLVNLVQATRRVAAGDYSTRLLGPERSELAFLAESFNTMAAELAASRAQVVQNEKIMAWQEIARRLAHELRNPLTPIRLSAERLSRRHQTDPDHLGEILEPAVGAILTEVTRLETLLKDFAGFARLPAPQKTSVELAPLVNELAASYRAAHPGVEIQLDGMTPGLRLIADGSQIEQVFVNLFKNAVEAMGGVGVVRVTANLVKKGTDSYCRIQVHDTGPGVPEDLRERLFQPYVTTKPDGTGLGLAIVERLVFDHGGRVWLESHPGFGTTFFLDLPAQENP